MSYDVLNQDRRERPDPAPRTLNRHPISQGSGTVRLRSDSLGVGELHM